mgnify:CR=1 FL=1
MDHYIPKRRIPVTLWADAVQGVQGHVAYPDKARNPIHQALPARSRYLDNPPEAATITLVSAN